MTIELITLEKRFEILEILFNTMPFLFWKDRKGRYQGLNSNQIHNLGLSSSEDFIGKTIYEILADQESAKLIDETDKQVMNEGITLILEEKIIVPIGERTFFSQKCPI